MPNSRHLERLILTAVRHIAEEQSVVGLVLAGLENDPDIRIPKQDLLRFVGQALQIEKLNNGMNSFISVIVQKMSDTGVFFTLVKGQGIAQCYERPLWRTSGDIDFLLDEENYEKAKTLLLPLATKVETEDKRRLHFGLFFNNWLVELHGSMRSGISAKMNKVVDEVQKDVCARGGIRCWKNNTVDVFLSNPDNEVILVFTHFVGHFYGKGIGLRQISTGAGCYGCIEKLLIPSSLNIE